MRFRKTLGLCTLIAALTLAVNTTNTAAANYVAGLGEACDCTARVIGLGWGDGYHACKSSDWSPRANLPPRSFVAYQRHQAKPRFRVCNYQLPRLTVYDHFDAGCESCCDAECQLSQSDCNCKSAVALSTETSPVEGRFLPVGRPVDQEAIAVAMPASPAMPASAPAMTASAPAMPGGLPKGMPHPMQLPRVRAIFQSFAEAATLGNPVPTDSPQLAERTRNTGPLVYPTLVAPPRAQSTELGANVAAPALRKLNRNNLSNAERLSQSTDLDVPESLRTYSTMRDIEARAASQPSKVRVWVVGTNEQGPILKRGIFSPQQQSEATPVIKSANRPSYPVDNVIRQPEIQR